METSINTLTVKNHPWSNLLAIADRQAEHKHLVFIFINISRSTLPAHTGCVNVLLSCANHRIANNL